MFKSVILHWLGAFKCFILTMRELGDDVTHSLTDRRTQPFIVKDIPPAVN